MIPEAPITFSESLKFKWKAIILQRNSNDPQFLLTMRNLIKLVNLCTIKNVLQSLKAHLKKKMHKLLYR